MLPPGGQKGNFVDLPAGSLYQRRGMKSVEVCNVELGADHCTLAVAFIHESSVCEARHDVLTLAAELQRALAEGRDAVVELEHDGESLRAVIPSVEVPLTLGAVEEAAADMRAYLGSLDHSRFIATA